MRVLIHLKLTTMSITTIANAAFKQGFCHATASIITSSGDSNGQGSIAHSEVMGAISEAWRGKVWTHNDLVQAGVDDNDLAVLMSYKKQLNL